MVNNGIFVLLLVYIFLIISKENEVVNTGVKSTNKHTFSITVSVSLDLLVTFGSSQK